MTELEAIRRYWNTRAEGYSLKTAYDLQHAEKVWLERLRPFVLASGKLDILDIGCGPGFFSILLARLGHSVVAFDYTEGMLERASRNAAEADVSIVVRQGDAQDLPFPDETFDLIVSRNLMWNLEHPESAYAEWLRVLRPGGRLVNFDGNHYRHLYSEPYAEELKQPDYTDGHKSGLHARGRSRPDRCHCREPAFEQSRPSAVGCGNAPQTGGTQCDG